MTAEAFQAASAWQVMLGGVAFFGAIYLAFGSVTWLLTRHVLPWLGLGRRLDPRPVPAGQLAREMRQSAVSVLIFGLGLVVPWCVLQLGWARLDPDPGAWQTVAEIAALALWNDIHFWLNHRLLHTPALRRFHGAHHCSIVTTPFATYSFHPLEALLLGNVILAPMLVHDFGFASLLALPIFSLAFNCIGHANYDFVPGVSHAHWFAASRRHHLHHACHAGNYGFQFTFMDRLFGTRLQADAARPLFDAFERRRSTR